MCFQSVPLIFLSSVYVCIPPIVSLSLSLSLCRYLCLQSGRITTIIIIIIIITLHYMSFCMPYMAVDTPVPVSKVQFTFNVLSIPTQSDTRLVYNRCTWIGLARTSCIQLIQ